MHFHGPSEHKLDGKQYDLEMHIVHELVDGPESETYKENLAVIGVMFELAEKSHPFVEMLKCEDLSHIETIHLK